MEEIFVCDTVFVLAERIPEHQTRIENNLSEDENN